MIYGVISFVLVPFKCVFVEFVVDVLVYLMPSFLLSVTSLMILHCFLQVSTHIPEVRSISDTNYSVRLYAQVPAVIEHDVTRLLR